MDVTAYARGILSRQAEAILPLNYQVGIGDWVPRPNYCHDNVRIWVSRSPQHKHVKGYNVFDLRLLIGAWRVQAHALVEFEDGKMIDITPHGDSQQYPFVRHIGTDEEFEIMAKVSFVDIPA